jgi:hypothetical protein
MNYNRGEVCLFYLVITRSFVRALIDHAVQWCLSLRLFDWLLFVLANVFSCRDTVFALLGARSAVII